MAEGGVPVRESVGAALRAVRENLPAVGLTSLIGAAVLTVLSIVALQSPVIGPLGSIVSTLISAFVYAALLGVALNGSAGLAQRVMADGGRVWAAMAVVGFFLCIVFFVLMIPGAIVLGILIAPEYGAELQSVQGDEAASMALMQRIITENPGALIAFALFYGLIWLALTSRLFLAAPASVDQRRILTFETWSWTKNNMLRISAARVMLLFPAYVLGIALSYMLALLLGINMLDPAATLAYAHENLVMYALFAFASSFILIAIYRSLEAGLSAYLYRGLKPQTAAPAG